MGKKRPTSTSLFVILTNSVQQKDKRKVWSSALWKFSPMSRIYFHSFLCMPQADCCCAIATFFQCTARPKNTFGSLIIKSEGTEIFARYFFLIVETDLMYNILFPYFRYSSSFSLSIRNKTDCVFGSKKSDVQVTVVEKVSQRCRNV